MNIAEEPLKRRGGGYDLPVAGFTISRCCFGRWIDMELGEDQDVAFRIEMPFRMRHWGHDQKLDPRKVETLQPVLALAGAVVLSAVASADGSLDVQMNDGGTELHVDPASHEPWRFRYGEGVLLVSRAGGGLTLFRDEGRRPDRRTRTREFEE